ncbi:MAG: exodeoxyribonuclease VII small subunit [Rikenellaceae bacterium]|nr:exodeoxyribonuclease VII small subunit [Rikenellaceae bacterium]
MDTNTPGYAEAIAEIERILDSFNNEQVDIDGLAAQVKRATELISMCREKLRKAEEDVAKVLREEPGEKG